MLPEQKTALEKLLARTKITETARAGETCIMGFFFEAARADEIDPELGQNIDEICNLIATGKRIACRHTEDWKPKRGSASLSSQQWELLIAVMLQWSKVDANTPDDEKGLAFHRLNAALVGLDLVREKDEVEFDEVFKPWAQANLNDLTATIVAEK